MQVISCICPLFGFWFRLQSRKCRSTGLSALQPVELTRHLFPSHSIPVPIPFHLHHWQLPHIPLSQLPLNSQIKLWSVPMPSLIVELSLHSLVIHLHTDICCQDGPSLIPFWFNLFDGKPLSNSAVSSSILANLYSRSLQIQIVWYHWYELWSDSQHWLAPATQSFNWLGVTSNLILVLQWQQSCPAFQICCYPKKGRCHGNFQLFG